MKFCAVILAAGRGKRMNSLKPKVLHEVLGRPILQYTIDAVKPLNPQRLIVVVGNAAEEVKKRINDDSIFFVTQKRLLGTGNALAEAREAMKDFKYTIVVLNGDSPLITAKTLKNLLNKHKRSKNSLSLLSFIDESVSGYGRVIRDKNGKVTGIIEDKHLTLEYRHIKELNAGIYAMEPEVLDYLDRLKKHSSSGEYYLTDIVEIASKMGKKINAYNCPPEEVRGVNTRKELYEVSELLNSRIISRWMKKGVTFVVPSASIVHPSVSIGRDTVIYPNTCLEGKTSIGKNCTIYPGTRICDSVIGNGVVVKDCTIIENSQIKDMSAVGPFAHLRPYSIVGRKVKIGNFVELKKATIGDYTKASHLSYIGDAVVGKNVNIGAGTITCNYDGQKKYITTIESGVFVGSDAQLIAPVKIGKGAYVAAGATITRDVPAGSLAISRTKQKNIEGWVKRRKARMKNRD
jgi:bifunctional UDP-N-acetylglucosamine pyrophosphorylase/glucosamine-1-phosphate N-acetyltransferase